tara:strand:+ start:242 stop:1075 length:834 start_codon:yes stop_codon:yes gene_type:complete
MSFKELTIVITTFKSSKVIENCLNSIKKECKVIVVENSNDKNFKIYIEKNYNNVTCVLSGSNLGYSKGNNIGLSMVKTKYALVLNPDTLLETNAIENFLSRVKNNFDFHLIGPANDQQKKIDNIKEDLIEVENLKGFAIFFNLEKFDKIFFDENYFLYFEEIDLCKRIKENDGKIYLDKKIIINHRGAQSVDTTSNHELEKNRNWHWMWSTYYFSKKFKGSVIAIIEIFPKLLSALYKYIFYLVINNKKNKEIYFSRLSGIINSIMGKKSWYRPFLD